MILHEPCPGCGDSVRALSLHIAPDGTRTASFECPCGKRWPSDRTPEFIVTVRRTASRYGPKKGTHPGLEIPGLFSPDETNPLYNNHIKNSYLSYMRESTLPPNVGESVGISQGVER